MRPSLRLLSFAALVATTACGESSSPAAPEAPALGSPRSQVLSGEAQQAIAGADAKDTLAVQFFSASGAPLAGTPVTWSTTGGKLALQASTTDANGIARTTIKADTKIGTSFVKATAGGAEASFVLFVNAGEPAAFEAMAMRTDTLTLDGAFSGAPARVFDAFRNPVGGTLVSVAIFEGDAAEPASTLTLQADETGAVRLPFSPISAPGRVRVVYTAGETSLVYSFVVLEIAP